MACRKRLPFAFEKAMAMISSDITSKKVHIRSVASSGMPETSSKEHPCAGCYMVIQCGDQRGSTVCISTCLRGIMEDWEVAQL